MRRLLELDDVPDALGVSLSSVDEESDDDEGLTDKK